MKSQFIHNVGEHGQKVQRGEDASPERIQLKQAPRAVPVQARLMRFTCAPFVRGAATAGRGLPKPVQHKMEQAFAAYFSDGQARGLADVAQRCGHLDTDAKRSNIAGTRGGAARGGAVLAEKMPIPCAFGLAEPARIEEIATIINVRINGIKKIQTTKNDPIRTRAIVAQEDGADFLETIMAHVNGYLAQGGVPAVHTVIEDVGLGWGSFNSSEWCMRFNLNKMLVERWTENNAKELAVTIYHELRHAEQWFVMARYVATTHPTFDSGQLAKMLQGSRLVPGSEMNIGVVEAAMALKTKKSSEIYKTGKALYDAEFEVGKGDDGELFGELSAHHLEVMVENDKTRVRLRTIMDEVSVYNAIKPLVPSDEVVAEQDTNPAAAKVVGMHASRPGSALFYNAYYNYMIEKRFVFTDLAVESYNAYMLGLPMENDAHAIETELRELLGVELGTKLNIPSPKLWSP